MVKRLACKALRSTLLFATIFSLALPTASPAKAAGKASLTLSQVDGSRFPTTVAYATVLSDKGYPVLGLTNKDFQVTENGVPTRSFTVSAAVDTDEPLAAVLTLDTSGSMDAAAMRAEKAAATRFLDGLRPQDQASVIAFSTDIRPVMDFTSDKDALTEAINGLSTGGNTALYDALYSSVEAASQTDTLRRVVVFMTDGRNTQRGASLDDGLNLATQQGIPVYTIGLGADLDRDVLSRIATRTGGTTLFAPTPATLNASYQAISDQLRSQYVITYDSPAPKGARVYRTTIATTVGGENLKAERPYEANPTAPSIDGLTLQDGQRIEGIVDVSLELSSTLPITAARVLINGREVERLTAAPFAFSLDTSQLSAGRQEIVFSAIDAAGSETSRRVQVVVPPMTPGETATSSLEASKLSPPFFDAPALTLPEVSLDNPIGRLASAIPQVQAPQLTLPSFEAPQLTLPSFEAPQFTLPSFEAPQIALPVVDPSGWPGASGIATVIQSGQQAASTVRQAPAMAESIQQGAYAGGATVLQQAKAEAPRLGMLAMILVGSTLLFFAGKRGLAAARQNLRRITCDDCGTIYQAFELECPNCYARDTQVEEPSLGEYLVQNNLLTVEHLHEIQPKSQELGQTLELTLLQEGLVSARELSQAHFYLSQSTEMHDRLNTAVVKSHNESHSKLRRRLPTASVPLSLALVAMAALGTSVPNVF